MRIFAVGSQNQIYMKKTFKLFFFSCLFVVATNGADAQVMSVMGNFSPSTSTLIGSASRIGFDNGAWSTYYMRYNGSSYFCSHHNYGYWSPLAPSVTSTKITLPQNFVITDFKKFLSDPGYIGSYQGKGMYGYTLGYNLYNNNYVSDNQIACGRPINPDNRSPSDRAKCRNRYEISLNRGKDRIPLYLSTKLPFGVLLVG